MALLRSGRCPSCRSDKVSVVTVGDPKLKYTLGLAALLVAGSYLFGFALTGAARGVKEFQVPAQCVQIWNYWVMTPMVLFLAPLYIMRTRLISKKRICQNCGKKWKVRSRGSDRGRGEELASAGSEAG